MEDKQKSSGIGKKILIYLIVGLIVFVVGFILGLQYGINMYFQIVTAMPRIISTLLIILVVLIIFAVLAIYFYFKLKKR